MKGNTERLNAANTDLGYEKKDKRMTKLIRNTAPWTHGQNIYVGRCNDMPNGRAYNDRLDETMWKPVIVVLDGEVA